MQLSYCQELQSFFLKICGIYLAIEKWRTSDIPKVEEINLKSIGLMFMGLCGSNCFRS
jgi:septum formation inhibitor MinC